MEQCSICIRFGRKMVRNPHCVSLLICNVVGLTLTDRQLPKSMQDGMMANTVDGFPLSQWSPLTLGIVPSGNTKSKVQHCYRVS